MSSERLTWNHYGNYLGRLNGVRLFTIAPYAQGGGYRLSTDLPGIPQSYGPLAVHYESQDDAQQAAERILTSWMRKMDMTFQDEPKESKVR